MMSATQEDRHIMARVVMRMFQKWQVTDDVGRRVLGSMDQATYDRWKAGEFRRIPKSILPRFEALIWIGWGVRILFSDPARGDAWMSRPNTLFNGATPLESIADGDMQSLARLRDYLLAETQPW